MKRKYYGPMVDWYEFPRQDVLLSSFDEENGDNLFDWDLE